MNLILNKKIPIFFIMGHTASNKTKIVFKLKDIFPIEIISVDSTLIFREMNIGTNKPNKEELIKYPHKIVNIRDPIQRYSVFDFCKDSLISIYDILLNNKIPLFVGGSMFYFKILLDGINLYNSLFINLEIKKYINNLKLDYIKDLYIRLKINKLNNSDILLKNKRKIYKEIEYYFLIKNSKKFNGLSNYLNKKYEIYQIILFNENKLNLSKKIKYRFYNMLENGFENEVINLYNRGDLNSNMQSIKAIGYNQMWSYLSNKITYNNMIKNSILSTNKLIKNQMKWIKNWKFYTNNFSNNNKSINKLVIYISKIIKNYYLYNNFIN